MLGVLKFSTMDPFGMGVEMEGGKPGTFPVLYAKLAFVCTDVHGVLVWVAVWYSFRQAAQFKLVS
jgi:hypothetical protein